MAHTQTRQGKADVSAGCSADNKAPNEEEARTGAMRRGSYEPLLHWGGEQQHGKLHARRCRSSVSVHVLAGRVTEISGAAGRAVAVEVSARRDGTSVTQANAKRIGGARGRQTAEQYGETGVEVIKRAGTRGTSDARGHRKRGVDARGGGPRAGRRPGPNTRKVAKASQRKKREGT